MSCTPIGRSPRGQIGATATGTGIHYTLAQIAAEPFERNRHLGHYTNFVNLLDLCALSVPGPFRCDGLPAGLTLIAPAWRDRWLAEIGSRVHRAAGVKLGATGFDLPPPAAARNAGKPMTPSWS